MRCTRGDCDCDGCGKCQEEEPLLHCPVCGAELMSMDLLYRTADQEIFGCENCVQAVYVYKVIDHVRNQQP